ncbi:MAG: hypothetical protein M3N93_09565 [Acidobacteriota bacterium]|nr:hypothetical protein [Acidobacteriota bacterium]
MTYSIFYSTRHLEIFCGILAAIAIFPAYFFPGLGSRFFRAFECHAGALARRPRLAFLAATLFPMLVRLLLLPVFPIPQPRVHDEFSYLLLGDTLSHGRLANPTPPEWRHFETEYELVRPTYASQYQPAQGVVLAAGQTIAKHPWWGVWFSAGLMCGALYWALAPVLPLQWALFGSAVAALQFGIFGFWMNSYFGGAVAAVAGALVFGSLNRLKRIARGKEAAGLGALAGFGLVILFASRPAEALLWAGVIAWMEIARIRRQWRSRNGPVTIGSIAAILLVVLAGAGGLAFYNQRVTGHALDLPYALYRRAYGVPQSYWVQPAVLVASFSNPQLEANYKDQLAFWMRRYSPALLWNSERRRLRDFWRFFIGPFLSPTILFLAFAVRRRKVFPWICASAPFILDHAAYHAWYPQQSGSETVLIVYLLVECWRQMRIAGRGRGRAVSRQLTGAFALAVFLLSAGLTARATGSPLPRWAGNILAGLAPEPSARELAIRQLENEPGRHLVFVHYGPAHSWYDEWVFNGADLMGSRIVFARVCDPVSDLALTRALSDRDLWMADPDAKTPLRRIRAELLSPDKTGRRQFDLN